MADWYIDRMLAAERAELEGSREPKMSTEREAFLAWWQDWCAGADALKDAEAVRNLAFAAWQAARQQPAQAVAHNKKIDVDVWCPICSAAFQVKAWATAPVPAEPAQAVGYAAPEALRLLAAGVQDSAAIVRKEDANLTDEQLGLDVPVYIAPVDAEQAVRNEWKDAVIEQLVVCHIFTAEHETNPRKALQDLIGWHVAIALDPQVSSDAAKLQEQAVRNALEAAAKVCEQVAENKLTAWQCLDAIRALAADPAEVKRLAEGDV